MRVSGFRGKTTFELWVAMMDLNLPKTDLFCRVPINSILGLIIRTYKKSIKGRLGFWLRKFRVW